MTRARELARLGNENVLSVEDDSLEAVSYTHLTLPTTPYV